MGNRPHRLSAWPALCAALLLSLSAADFPILAAPAGTGAGLIADGDFETNISSGQLRAHSKEPGWYESRQDGKEGRRLLQLSQKKVSGNATRKAMIKASPQFNTYLTQGLAQRQEGVFSLQWDILVKEILPPFNRSAFQMIGSAVVRGKGPNGTGKERFVFLGFENASLPGKINLFAFEGGDTEQWDTRRVLVRDLDLKKWYTVRVDVDVAAQRYRVSVQGVTASPIDVGAFRAAKDKPPKILTHVSFASWNDGPGTFYVDNVREP